MGCRTNQKLSFFTPESHKQAGFETLVRQPSCVSHKRSGFNKSRISPASVFHRGGLNSNNVGNASPPVYLTRSAFIVGRIPWRHWSVPTPVNGEFS
jgi:hypothetical protein